MIERAVLDLIIKDLTFNKARVALAFLGSLSFSSVMMLGGLQGMPLAFLGAQGFLFFEVVDRNCYMDDKYDAYKFLKSMPVRRSHIVVSKYLAAIGVILIGFMIAYATRVVIAHPAIISFMAQIDNAAELSPFNIPFMIFLSSVMLAFFSLHLWLFFKSDYATAQQARYAVALVIFAFGMFAKENKALTMSIMSGTAVYLFPVAALATFVVLCRSSVKAFLVKE